MTNRIRNLTTDVAELPDREVPAVVMGIDLNDPSNAETFIAEVVENVRNQRMCSPPTTAVLLITLMGSVDAATFKRLWLSALAQDKVLSFFMSQMKEAVVIRGTPKGEVLEELSLI